MKTYNDPTYNKTEIDANPVWKRAFKLSEIQNDNAPLGWSQYIPQAEEQLKEDAEAIAILRSVGAHKQ